MAKAETVKVRIVRGTVIKGKGPVKVDSEHDVDPRDAQELFRTNKAVPAENKKAKTENREEELEQSTSKRGKGKGKSKK